MTIRKFNFTQTAKLNWFTISIGIALIAAFFLFRNWQIDQNFIGIVESKSHVLGAQEAGKVYKMLISVGERVKQGQVLAIMDVSDLKAIVGQLNEELLNIKNSEGARRNHSTIMVQNLRLQLENEAAELMDRLSSIEAKSTELSGLNKEIERLKNAEEAGLGFNRDLSDLSVQRDALASYLREQSKDLDTQNEKLEQARQSRNLLGQADNKLLATSFFVEQMEHAESLKRLISETEHRIKLRTISAPCDGYVTEILARAGDVVQDFRPVVTIDEIIPRFLTIYIPEKSTIEIQKGDNIRITSSRDAKFNTTGKVVFVHPGFSMVGERISFRGQFFWARKVRIALDKNHNLIPGELVTTRLTHENLTASYFMETNNQNEESPLENLKGAACSEISDIKIGEQISKSTRFEPSGISWIPELGKFLVVSDDTGLQNDKSAHTAKLFLMNKNGVLDDDPLVLSGINELKDIEAVTRAENGNYYLVASQNISKNGKRSAARELIIKVNYRNGIIKVIDKIALLTLLENSYSQTILNDLGLTGKESDGRPHINIEGAAYYNNALYLGLKEPLDEKGAIIWKLDDPEKMFKTKTLNEKQLSVYGYVRMEKYNDQTPGISDLFIDKSGKMWILSTIANAQSKNQMGGFYSIDQTVEGVLRAIKHCNFPGLKPEGIAPLNENQFMIVFDKDNNIPAFCIIDMEGN